MSKFWVIVSIVSKLAELGILKFPLTNSNFEQTFVLDKIYHIYHISFLTKGPQALKLM